MEIISGGCLGNNGTDICVILGFVPQWIFFQIDASNPTTFMWNREGTLYSNSDVGGLLNNNSTFSDLSAANGVTVYSGGDKIIYDGTTDNRWEVHESAITFPAGDIALAADVTGKFYWGGHVKNASTDDDEVEYPVHVLGSDTPKDGTVLRLPPGFFLGASSVLNPNGARVSWLAIGQRM